MIIILAIILITIIENVPVGPHPTPACVSGIPGIKERLKQRNHKNDKHLLHKNIPK
jgi:hypothetical protein